MDGIGAIGNGSPVSGHVVLMPDSSWLNRYYYVGDLPCAELYHEGVLANKERVYANVHKMVEKYNVEDITLEAGGGEYPVQDGFGWSNGVCLRMEIEARN